jgi:hypothetical protein
MIGDAGWALMAIAILAVELRSRRPQSDVVGAGDVVGFLRRRPVGRFALFVLWCFIAVHLFSRYGVQR